MRKWCGIASGVFVLDARAAEGDRGDRIHSSRAMKSGEAERAEQVAGTVPRAGRAGGLTRLRVTAISAGILVVLATAVAGWPRARANLQAIYVLREVAGQRSPGALRRLVDAPVVRRDVNFTIGSGANAHIVRARMYVPVGQPDAPGMVILHGVHYLGIDEPRLMSFAEAMATCGIRVLTPELPDIKDYHVGASSVETIGASVRWMAEGAGERGRAIRPVGVMGLSFSGGLALIAAAEPEYRPYFRFVFAVGAHDSMARVARYYLTGEDPRPDGSVERLAPNDYGALILEYEYLDEFVPPADLAAVRGVLRAHLYEDSAGQVRALAGLNEEQRREAQALMDANSPPMRARIAAVMARHTAALDAVSPAGSLARVETPVYLLHGEADDVVPAAETLWIARGLPPRDVKAVLVSPVLSHLDIEKGPGVWDQLRLMHFFAGVLEAEERG